ncbi:CoA-substrate-specific enzyme activase [Gottschalkia acidurici 9a]|uniref:CoA-substrate-specific enzyme activase n=1 Tax=Gottschalkia acidurici (strain ATCC 7906 / DSM 604 / BCRC 14475 / CIP 104303 / KCTC 5404 / NCIMB 10678 / 9a) TaxID=1128398 RepID=K0AXI2_GOTA9|nr:CoA-substrate-specific enzyme activase [Gottschalkia acidurici 9a]
MYSLGIDIGYSSIKLTLINKNNEVKYKEYLLHKGNIKEAFRKSIHDLLLKYDREDIGFGAVTGSGSEILTKSKEIDAVNEITSIIEGSLNIDKNIGSIIEIGGQSAKYITDFSENDKSQIKFSINSNCAAGTGAFLEEQIYRLNLKLEDYSKLTDRAKTIPRIAGRCSVFAKTDIIHHQQEGVSVEDILLGLSYSVIKNYKGTIIKKLPIKKPILFIGGVASNTSIIRALEDVLVLDEDELIVPEYFSNIASLGASIIAKKENKKISMEQIIESIEKLDKVQIQEHINTLPKLKLFGDGDSVNKHICKSLDNSENKLDCFLGVDIGSTSTNLVLIDSNNEVLSYKYLRTLGDPVEAVNKGLKELESEFKNKIKVAGVGTTGSGRYMVGKLIGADIIKDEITAQGKAATTIDKNVDTIFEIGGQDSKYISCKDGVITDFEMNKICAAGTGSFIEEQAKKLNVPLNELSQLSLKSNSAINLGERCTVFIETNVATSLAKGAEIEDIVSGLCYSIVKNYLNRVVGQKKIGEKIFLQGGIAYNQGIVNAFRQTIGKEVIVPPFFSVTGALGVAILAKEQMMDRKTSFRGFKIDKNYDWIKENTNKELKKNESNIYEETELLYLKNYDGIIDDKKQTVGIPRVLFLHKLFPMFNIYFKTLGFNVILSDQTNEKTVALSQENSLDETCYPVKLINGHVAELISKNVDYIFLPSLYTMKHDVSTTRQDYGCAYMQQAPKIVQQTMRLEERGIKLLSPVLSFNFGKRYMMKTLLDLGKSLDKKTIQTARAIQKGMVALKTFEKSVEKIGDRIIENLEPDEKVFVIITRAYGVIDPVLNMGIAEKIMKMGYKVITLSNLPAHDHDTSKEHPNMYWPFGQHILSGAQIVNKHPNLYAIYLTNHGCGPDTILAHYFKEEMKEKPYLAIEVDEHSSSVGVITRVEAFINSIGTEKASSEKAKSLKVYSDMVAHKEVNMHNNLNNIKEEDLAFIPYMYPYSDIFKEILVKEGIDTKILPMTDEKSIEIGREFTITKEYLSLTSMLGDVFKKIRELNSSENINFIIPTSEGTEASRQYSRLVRTKLDEEGFENINVISPFIEDLILESEENLEKIFLGFIAGDIVRLSDVSNREIVLKKILSLINNNKFSIENLKDISKEIYLDLKSVEMKKKILVIGEPMILFNDFLSNYTLKDIEDQKNRVVYAPMSEYMWFVWKDFLSNTKDKKVKSLQKTIEQRLNKLKLYMSNISDMLLEETSFEKDLEELVCIADENLKKYSGGNGRYRQAKTLGNLKNIDGILTLASMYENTNTILNIIEKETNQDKSKPILNLTFDGNKNKSDEMKVESFMYYI